MAGLLAIVLPGHSAWGDAQKVTCCFDWPEVAVWDAGSRAWYVSNSDFLYAHQGGYISKLSADGDVVSQEWVTGITGPYDMAVHKGKLFVSNEYAHELLVIDIATARITRKVRLPKESEAISGVAADPTNGDVYVADYNTDSIYRVAGASSSKPRVSVFLRTPQLEEPYDLLVEKNRLVVAAAGPGWFTTSYDPTQGRLLTVDKHTKRVTPLTERFGLAAGIVKLERDYITDDWTSGRILRVHPNGEIETTSVHSTSTVGLGIDPARRLLSVPNEAEGVVVFEKL
jgi:DNA-binding beta-propeller fold protein YncE